jgi:peroxiredoxin
MPNLTGIPFPNIPLPSTDGQIPNFKSRAVVFFYPYTGKPGHPDPEHWDNIPGAHGSTPQALAFSRLYDQFAMLDVSIFGISFQSTEWQQDFVSRNNLRFTLLSDEKRSLSTALGLKTFKAGTSDYLDRRTLVVANNLITHDFYPVPQPENNADDVLKALQP